MSLSLPINEQSTSQRWWWPYLHPTVVKIFVVLFVVKVGLGAAAGIGLASQRVLTDWVWLLNEWNLTYDFGWAELTEGEGSLFWIVAANGYENTDAKNIAKFPLYPAVARTIWDLTGRQLSLPFILSFIHSLMVWAGIAEIYRFWEKYHEGYGTRAVIWLLVSPLLVLHLWLASYMEPGFLALMWLSLTLEYNRKWAASSAVLLCLTMLQPSGVILACFIGVRRLYQWLQRQIPFSAVIWALLPGVAWGLWMLLTSVWFNRVLAPYAYQEDWGRTVYRWPWDRWRRYNEVAFEEGFSPGHFVANISVAWMALGFVWGSWLWIKLSAQQRNRLGGVWVLPLFTVVAVLLPFSTLVLGSKRYALTSLIGVWPLLFSEVLQNHPRFRQYEKLIWGVSLLICLIILFAFVTGYRHTWRLYF